MDNLGAIGGPLLAIGLVGLVGVRAAIGLSVIPGLLAAVAIMYAIRHTAAAQARTHQPIRIRVRPVLRGRLGRLMVGVLAFELGNAAATLLILRATDLFEPGRSQTAATQLALVAIARGSHAVPPASRSWCLCPELHAPPRVRLPSQLYAGIDGARALCCPGALLYSTAVSPGIHLLGRRGALRRKVPGGDCMSGPARVSGPTARPCLLMHLKPPDVADQSSCAALAPRRLGLFVAAPWPCACRAGQPAA